MLGFRNRFKTITVRHPSLFIIAELKGALFNRSDSPTNNLLHYGTLTEVIDCFTAWLL